MVSTTTARVSAASFRDPGGCVLSVDGGIFRFVNAGGAPHLGEWLDSEFARRLVESGQVVRTEVLDDRSAGRVLEKPGAQTLFEAVQGTLVLEHERVVFPTFPYEWAPEMLQAAGLLTIDIALAGIEAGFLLKDGTPYNILFRGPNPVFVDVLSFERREPRDPRWLAYAQFVRTFLLPLLANKALGIPIGELLTARRDGLEPEDVYAWLHFWKRLQPPYLSLVSIPKWLGSTHDRSNTAIYEAKLESDPEKATFIVESLLRRLRKTLLGLAPAARRASTWSDYMTPEHNNYSSVQFEEKQAFVRQAMEEHAPRSVLDVGCNTGTFSVLAAELGADVVGIDYDPVVVGQVWKTARAKRLRILPLVVNLANPTPAAGWRNREWPSFLERATGAFEGVLMLAVLHHLLVTERVPLHDVLDLAAQITTDILVIEFVEPSDSMFKQLTRGRDHLHSDLTQAVFEEACGRHFDILRSQRLTGAARTLYLLRKTRA